MTADEVTSSTNEADAEYSSRRSLLTKGAIAAAVATVAGVTLSKGQVLAANGETMIVGVANTGTNTTRLDGGSTFHVLNGNSLAKASVYGQQTAAAAAGSIGVHGRNSSTSGFGVWGLNLANNGAGVYGEHDNSTVVGTGVIGKSDSGAGVRGEGSSFDLVAAGSGRINLALGGFPANPTANGFQGTIAADPAGNLYFSPASGQYRLLTSPVFVPISPIRVYDSRLPVPSPGKLVVGAPRVVSVKDGRDQATGAVTAADAVPAGATAVAYNLTISQTENSGYLSVVPGDAANESGSSINWSTAGQDIANGLIGTISATREFKVFAGGGGTTHFIIDINGYFI